MSAITVITKNALSDGLYKYADGKVTLNNKSNIDKQELKKRPEPRYWY